MCKVYKNRGRILEKKAKTLKNSVFLPFFGGMAGLNPIKMYTKTKVIEV